MQRRAAGAVACDIEAHETAEQRGAQAEAAIVVAAVVEGEARHAAGDREVLVEPPLVLGEDPFLTLELIAREIVANGDRVLVLLVDGDAPVLVARPDHAGADEEPLDLLAPLPLGPIEGKVQHVEAEQQRHVDELVAPVGARTLEVEQDLVAVKLDLPAERQFAAQRGAVEPGGACQREGRDRRPAPLRLTGDQRQSRREHVTEAELRHAQRPEQGAVRVLAPERQAYVVELILVVAGDE